MTFEVAMPATASALGRIRAMLSSLPPSDRRAAEVIAQRGTEILSCSITQVAQEANVAESTVIRACKRLGFGGFQAIKLAIAKDSQTPTRYLADEVEEGDDTSLILGKVFAGSAAVLEDAATSVDSGRMAVLVDAVSAANTVLVTGFGPSSPIAQDAAYRLRTLGIRVDAPTDSLTQHLAAAMLRDTDVCIAVSHTGATRETLEVVRAAKERGALTAAVTSFARSPLTELADHSLIAGGRQAGFRVEAMASRLAHICVFDSLYIALAMRSPDDSRAALDLHHEVSSAHQL